MRESKLKPASRMATEEPISLWMTVSAMLAQQRKTVPCTQGSGINKEWGWLAVIGKHPLPAATEHSNGEFRDFEPDEGCHLLSDCRWQR